MKTNAGTRLYASSIAIVSGLYAIGSATTGLASMGTGGIGIGGWIMLVIGAVVLLHGLLLLSPTAESLGQVSGPLMVVWAMIMLANQTLAALLSGWAMGGFMMSRDLMAGGPTWDAGMVAIAILMLVSGLIMIRRPTM